MELGYCKAHEYLKVLQLHNHLEHAQPTWRWQIISGRNIWLAHGWPTDKDGEDDHRRNGAVLNHSKYMAKSSYKFHNDTSNKSE